MNPLLARFISEAQELIQQSAAGILKLEKDPENEAGVNEVFRAIHTLKGSSGLFDAQPLTKLLHAGEDVLSAVRSGALRLSPDIADHILDMLDQAGVWLGDLEKHEELPVAAADVSRKLARALRDFLPSVEGASARVERQQAAEAGGFEWLEEIRRAPGYEAFATAAAASSRPVVAVEYRPDQACFYSGEDPANLMRQVPELGVLSVSLRAPWPSLEDLDPYRCNFVFRALTLAASDEVAHLFRYVMDQVSILALPPGSLPPKKSQSMSRRPSPAPREAPCRSRASHRTNPDDGVCAAWRRRGGAKKAARIREGGFVECHRRSWRRAPLARIRSRRRSEYGRLACRLHRELGAIQSSRRQRRRAAFEARRSRRLRLSRARPIGGASFGWRPAQWRDP